MRIREKMLCIAVLYTLVSIHIALAQTPCVNLSIPERVYRDTATTFITAPNWRIGFLSQPKYGLVPIQFQDKALFMAQSEAELYDFTSGQWSVMEMTYPRRMKAAAAAGRYVYFAGGSTGPLSAPQYSNVVDIYDNITGKWSTSKLCGARVVGASGAVGNKVLFAGGIGHNGCSDKVDMFDAETNNHTTASLSQSRCNMAVGIAGSEILFAGGQTIIQGRPQSCDRVDIYNSATGLWCAHTLSSPRCNIAVAVLEGKIIFAGGAIGSGTYAQPSAGIDIYDASSGQWTVATLLQARYNITAIAANGKAYFAGGVSDTLGTLSDKVEIYDLATNSWSCITLSAPRAAMSTGYTHTRLMFAGGFAGTHDESNITDRVEVLTLATGQWTVERLHQPMFGVSTASYNGKVLFVGGACVSQPYPHCTQNPGEIDIWVDESKEFPFPENMETTGQSITLKDVVKTKANPSVIFANPAIDPVISIDLSGYRYKTVQITLLDKQKNSVLCVDAFPFESITEEINISALPDGYYWLMIEANGSRPDARMLLVKR